MTDRNRDFFDSLSERVGNSPGAIPPRPNLAQAAREMRQRQMEHQLATIRGTVDHSQVDQELRAPFVVGPPGAHTITEEPALSDVQLEATRHPMEEPEKCASCESCKHYLTAPVSRETSRGIPEAFVMQLRDGDAKHGGATFLSFALCSRTNTLFIEHMVEGKVAHRWPLPTMRESCMDPDVVRERTTGKKPERKMFE